MTGPRRAPAPGERQRDAERTRSALLDAARVEFAAKGLAGARVSEIAERAGVNKQLISYYFGGKDGLHQAIVDAWHAQEDAELSDPQMPLADLVVGYLRVAHAQRDLQRLFVRESLDGAAGGAPLEGEDEDLVRMRARQERGELAPEVDPGFVQLFLQAMVSAGVVFPGDAQRLTGLDPTSDAYLERAEQQLRLWVERLG